MLDLTSAAPAQFPSSPKHVSFLDKGPVMIYLGQLELNEAMWSPGESELVIGLWMRKDKRSRPSESPRLSAKIAKNFSLLVERRVSPGPSGRLRAQYMQETAAEVAPLGRFIERVRGSSFNDISVTQEAMPKAPAIPLPKSVLLSSQLCLTVRKENSQDVLGASVFHVWELVYNPERKVMLSLGPSILTEERLGSFSVRAPTPGQTRRREGSMERRHSWAGGRVSGDSSRLSRLPSPKRTATRRRNKSVSYLGEESDEEIVPYPELSTPVRTKLSGVSNSSAGDMSMTMLGMCQVHLAPHSISQRDGGVLGVQNIDGGVLSTSIRRAFDVPYDSNWVIGKASDPLVQAAYDFWRMSHALIPQRVCVEGVLLFEDLYKQDETFVRPIKAGGNDQWSFRYIEGAAALSLSESTGDRSSGAFRLDRALRHKSALFRRDKDFEKELARVATPDRDKDVYVDKDLLMYKIGLWTDTQNIEPQFQDSWEMLPGDKMYALKREANNLGRLGKGRSLGSPRAM